MCKSTLIFVLLFTSTGYKTLNILSDVKKIPLQDFKLSFKGISICEGLKPLIRLFTCLF